MLILVLAAAVAMSSCSPLYIPSARTVNHFTSKHEVNATGLIDWSGFEGRAAFSATNHVMVHAGFSKSIYGLANDSDTAHVGGMEGSYDHRMVEIGTGYYGKILGAYTEFEGGFSHGKSDAFEDVPSDPDNTPRSGPSRVINAEYNRFYVNAGVRLLEKDGFRVSAILRVSALKFSKMESETKHLVASIDRPYYYFEPAIDMRYDIDKTPLYFLANFSFCRSTKSGQTQGRGIARIGAVPEVWGWGQVIGIGIHLGKRNQSN